MVLLIALPSGLFIAGTNAMADSTVSDTSPTATCQTVVERYRAPVDAHHGESPLKVLFAAKDSGITGSADASDKNLDRDAKGDIDWIGWGSKQKPPIAMGDFGHDYSGMYPGISRLPGTDTYFVASQDGTAHCYSTDWFEVVHGKARSLAAPPAFGDDCMALDATGTVNHVPVFFEEFYDFGTSMDASLNVATWSHGGFHDACTVTFHYEPKFDEKTLNDWGNWKDKGETCKGPSCPALGKEAFALAAAVQADPGKAFKDRMAQLSKAQSEAFLAAPPPTDNGGSDTASRSQDAASSATDAATAAANASKIDPADLLDSSPMELPLLVDHRLYVATLGHYTVGWRQFADWDVRFYEIAGGKLVAVGAFPVGMWKGELRSVDVGAFVEKKDGQ